MRNLSDYTDYKPRYQVKSINNLVIAEFSNIFLKQLSTPIEPSASDHEPKGEGGGQTCPQKVNNAPTLKGPKSSPITLVLAINSSRL